METKDKTRNEKDAKNRTNRAKQLKCKERTICQANQLKDDNRLWGNVQPDAKLN